MYHDLLSLEKWLNSTCEDKLMIPLPFIGTFQIHLKYIPHQYLFLLTQMNSQVMSLNINLNAWCLSTYLPFTSGRHICFHPRMVVLLALSYSWVRVILVILLILAILTRHVTYNGFKDTKKVEKFIFASSLVYYICIPLKYILDDVLASFVVNLLPSLATT